MQHSKIVLALLLTLVCAVAGCGPDEYVAPEPKLPPATQVGANTFGCRIDGKAYVPDVLGCFAIPAERPVSMYYDNTFRFGNYTELNFFTRMCSAAKVFSFTKLQIDTLGAYSFNGNFCDIQTCDKAQVGLNGTDIYNMTSGQIVITKLDTTRKIISGTFTFSLNNGNQSLSVSDGRFDFKYPFP